ncbi:outer membrane lipid asymmetry maintenance protein MlaD [Azospirillum agricola]|uniref:outer membrane lipid asymmetry maintenance protein MlaD n=1 Tax=Azospirillum agricola TaxID=1720247 RepID=UPI000A0F24E9|nr:outer membrane lipid asymmetry maintenance protein MlaD [Azospirillum agricola]MBP2230156.1 phospholipid/cholesterol/gamma-HCH transport system substrate-binding protein [Azospirillum agricola]SMH53523.1 phospholipid/cholesterol/gamma-HCH transport system substrate-binding protein [Azospirillum lipoferum]
MRRNVIETVLGGVVLAAAAVFLAFAYKSADLRKVQGYELTANFSSITGLQSGADVRISGVKVGSVSALTLDPKSYQAVVHLSLDNTVKLPKDTAAVIASESLLGGKFLSLEPGGDPDTIQPNGRIEYTQSTPGLEQLLGQVIFSLQSMSKPADQAAGAQPPKM